MIKENISVTGGAGFVGSTLVDELIREGHRVSVIDSLITGKRDYINPQADFFEVDICSDKINKIFKEGGFNIVFHLAAQIDPCYSVQHPEIDNQVNVFGGLNILRNCLDNNVDKIIFASTAAVYGDTNQVPTNEEVLPYPMYPYGIHKLTFEKYLSYYYKVYGQKYTIIRPANIYGPRQYKGGEAGVVSIFIDNAVHGRKSVMSGDGTQTRDFVYVDDVIQALVKAMNFNYMGEINVGTGVETNLLQIVDAIDSAMDQNIEVEHGPARPAEQMRSCLDCQRAKEILNWESKIDLTEGIKRTLEWSRNKFAYL